MFNQLLYNEASVFNKKKKIMPSAFCRFTPFLRISPDFFLAGVQKGGTSSLYAALISHPQIIPAKEKEIFYYGNTTNFNKGDNYYKQFFATRVYRKMHQLKTGKRSLTLDASTNTFDSAEAPGRIIQSIPKARIIIIFRDPVERAFSHYKFSVKNGFENASFEKALELEETRINSASQNPLSDPYHNYVIQRLGYFKRGVYANYMPNWLNVFDRKNIYFTSSERLFKDPGAVYNEITDFLEIDRYSNLKFQRLNEGSSDKMDPKTFRYLRDAYKPHNERLFALLEQQYDW